MKKITLKLSIVMMLFMTMVSCKKDFTEELEASNEAANKEALLPPSADNYYIDSIIINDGTIPKVVKFNYDVPNKKVQVSSKRLVGAGLLDYDMILNYNYNWLLENLEDTRFNASPSNFNFLYHSNSNLKNVIIDSKNSTIALLNQKPSSISTAFLPYCDLISCVNFTQYNFNYKYSTNGNLLQTNISSKPLAQNIYKYALKYTYFSNIKNPFKNLKVPADINFINASYGLTPSLLMRMSPDLPFNFTSNSLSNKITYARGGNNISTLNSVVNSTFLTLPLAAGID